MQSPSDYPCAVKKAQELYDDAKSILNTFVGGFYQGTVPFNPKQWRDILEKMILSVELFLKVLSDDWGNGKTRFGHKVGLMYFTVFKQPYTDDPDFMRLLEESLKNQKYLLLPQQDMIDRFDQLDSLCLKLLHESRKWSFFKKQQQSLGEVVSAEATFSMPLRIRDFIANNCRRWYSMKCDFLQRRTPKEMFKEYEERCETIKRNMKNLDKFQFYSCWGW